MHIALAIIPFFLSLFQMHVMRDNRAHDIGILGGTWGAKLTDPELRKAWDLSFRNIFGNKRARETRTKPGADQYLLNR